MSGPSAAAGSGAHSAQPVRKKPKPFMVLPGSGQAERDCDDRRRMQHLNSLYLQLRIGNIEAGDLERLDGLGKGSGGVVYRVRHRPTNRIMALKIIHVEPNPLVLNRIVAELQFLRQCSSPFIVELYGSFYENSELSILMEYMDCGSLDQISRQGIRVPEDIVGKISAGVLCGLKYLKEAHNVMHRDIKPSNILINSRGEVKLCDLGVSGIMIESVVNTFVGSLSYMAPERLNALPYSVAADIWSLGLAMMELVLGRYPIPSPSPVEFENIFKSKQSKPEENSAVLSIIAHLDYIVSEPSPSIPKGYVSAKFKDFLDKSLQKDPSMRPSVKSLLEHEFMQRVKRRNPDLAGWICIVKSRTGIYEISPSREGSSFQIMLRMFVSSVRNFLGKNH